MVHEFFVQGPHGDVPNTWPESIAKTSVQLAGAILLFMSLVVNSQNKNSLITDNY